MFDEGKQQEAKTYQELDMAYYLVILTVNTMKSIS